MARTEARRMGRWGVAHGIRVNCVRPGLLTAPHGGAGSGAPLKMAKDLKQRLSLVRRGSAQEVAAAVVFLASRSASYVAARGEVPLPTHRRAGITYRPSPLAPTGTTRPHSTTDPCTGQAVKATLPWAVCGLSPTLMEERTPESPCT